MDLKGEKGALFTGGCGAKRTTVTGSGENQSVAKRANYKIAEKKRKRGRRGRRRDRTW